MNANWRDEAACKGRPTAWWYETAGAGSGSIKTGPAAGYPNARPICASCPVKAACLADARETEQLSDLRVRVPIHGLRAGLTPLERYKLRSTSKKYRRIA